VIKKLTRPNRENGSPATLSSGQGVNIKAAGTPAPRKKPGGLVQ
jgi:hypothetical protein